MSEVSYWFYISDDYRSGRDIHVYEKEISNDSDSDNTPEEAVKYTFEVPIKNARMYIVNEFPTYEIIWRMDLNEDANFETMYQKVYSQIYKCMPFQFTGYNSAYKETGYYPEITEEIRNMPPIATRFISGISENIRNEGFIYFVSIVNDDGELVFTKLL